MIEMTSKRLHCDLALKQSYCLHSYTKSQGNRAWGMNLISIKQIFIIGGMMQFQFCFVFCLQSSSQVLLIKKSYTQVYKARYMFS